MENHSTNTETFRYHRSGEILAHYRDRISDELIYRYMRETRGINPEEVFDIGHLPSIVRLDVRRIILEQVLCDDIYPMCDDPIERGLIYSYLLNSFSTEDYLYNYEEINGLTHSDPINQVLHELGKKINHLLCFNERKRDGLIITKSDWATMLVEKFYPFLASIRDKEELENAISQIDFILDRNNQGHLDDGAETQYARIYFYEALFTKILDAHSEEQGIDKERIHNIADEIGDTIKIDSFGDRSNEENCRAWAEMIADKFIPVLQDVKNERDIFFTLIHIKSAILDRNKGSYEERNNALLYVYQELALRLFQITMLNTPRNHC
ncbi:hypothetical protein ACFLZH_04090 [Patescibacteria group bacterium]